jgi:hypothetical protein
MLLLLALLVLPSAPAQTNDNNGTPSEPRFRPQRNRPNEPLLPGGAARFAFGPDRLFGLLTPEQRASLRDAASDERGKMRVVEEKLRDARRVLYQTALLDKFDEGTVRQKAKAVAELDAELTVMRLKILSQVKPPLTAEQLQKLAAPQAQESPAQEERPTRTRPDLQRDEHGLPPKDRVPSEPK